MTATKPIRLPKLRDGSHRYLGVFDNAYRWWPLDELAAIPGLFDVRLPSKAYPYSCLRHVYTARFSQRLFAARPQLWAQCQGLIFLGDTAEAALAAITAGRFGLNAHNGKGGGSPS